MQQSIPDNPKAACENYITEVETLYYPWYDAIASRHYYFWCILQGLATLAGFATAVLAALIKKEALDGFGWSRVSLIVLPFLGSLASTLLVQLRIRALLGLRERGRQAFQHLIEQGMVRFAAASSPDDYTKVHRWLVEEAAAIEREQSRGFFQIAPAPTGKKEITP
jgi:hypothetical protein